MEKHSVLTPALLTEIISSKVSDTTGQLAAPVMARLRTSSTARASSRPGVGSPVIFSSSPSDSPLKAFLDSPHTRQVTGYQKLLEERTVLNRELR